LLRYQLCSVTVGKRRGGCTGAGPTGVRAEPPHAESTISQANRFMESATQHASCHADLPGNSSAIVNCGSQRSRRGVARMGFVFDEKRMVTERAGRASDHPCARSYSTSLRWLARFARGADFSSLLCTATGAGTGAGASPPPVSTSSGTSSGHTVPRCSPSTIAA